MHRFRFSEYGKNTKRDIEVEREGEKKEERWCDVIWMEVDYTPRL